MNQAATIIVCAALIALLVTCGCSTPSEGVSGSTEGKSPVPASPHIHEGTLEGTTWYLVAFHTASGRSSEVIPGSEITIFLDGKGRITGNAGCNRYTASYTLSSDLLSIGSPDITQNYCASTPGIMVQESVFLSDLQRVTRSTIDENILTMIGRNGAPLLTYSNIKSPSAQ